MGLHGPGPLTSQIKNCGFGSQSLEMHQEAGRHDPRPPPAHTAVHSDALQQNRTLGMFGNDPFRR